MKKPNIAALAGICAAVVLAAGCETASPTHVAVTNAYPKQKDRDALVVQELWWSTTLFDDAIAIDDTSDTQRTVEGSDYAYAVIGGTAVHGPIPLRSKQELSVKRGDTLHIEVSDRTFDGRCDGGNALTQRDADFVTQRIFPGTFANIRYEAATCTGTALTPDAGATPDAAQADEDGGR